MDDAEECAADLDDVAMTMMTPVHRGRLVESSSSSSSDVYPTTERKRECDGQTQKRSVARALTGKVIDMIVNEMDRTETQQRIKEGIIDPLVHMLYVQMFPYLLVICAVVLVILMLSLCTCAMFARFVFRR